MGNTWVVDLRHYLDPSGAFAVMPTPARRLAEYFASIVVDAQRILMMNPASAVAAARDGAVAPASSCRIRAPMTWSAFIGTAPFATTTGSSAAGRTRSGTGSRQTKGLISRRQLRGSLIAYVLFVWLGVGTALHGFLLWPAVILHAGLAAALLRQLLNLGSVAT
jgi:hypothetical protein